MRIPLLSTWLLPWAALLGALCGCVAVEEPADMTRWSKVVSAHGPRAPFRQPGTFAYDSRSKVEIRDMRIDTFAVERTIRETITAELDARGLRQVRRGEAAYSIHYLGVAEDAVLLRDLLRSTGPFDGDTGDAEVPHGALVVTVREVASGGLVWHGFIEAVVTPDAEPEVRRVRVARGVRLLLDQL